MKRLPLCPCQSGKLYEECCWNRIDITGKRKYERGLLTQDAQGVWHPIPNASLQMVVGGSSIDEHSKYGLGLTQDLKLSENQRSKLSKNLSIFHRAYSGLLNYLQTPQGTNVSFCFDSTGLRGLWRAYLMDGRILLDLIGHYSNLLLNFEKKIGGLNKKKIKTMHGALHFLFSLALKIPTYTTLNLNVATQAQSSFNI